MNQVIAKSIYVCEAFMRESVALLTAFYSVVTLDDARSDPRVLAIWSVSKALASPNDPSFNIDLITEAVVSEES